MCNVSSGRASGEEQKAEAANIEPVNGGSASELLLEQVMQSERAFLCTGLRCGQCHHVEAHMLEAPQTAAK